MASAEARHLNELHRLAQARLGQRVVVQSFASWRLVDPNRLDESTAQWLAVLVPLIQANRHASAQLAANYLSASRAIQIGVDTDSFVPVVAGDAPADQVVTSLIVTGPVSVKRAMLRGVSLGRAVDTAQSASARAAVRHVLDGGRETVRETGKIDPRGRGWVRVLSGKPCPFCQSLAAEGDAFTSHDGCSCSAAPAYA